MWAGPVLRPSTILTERTGSRVRTRDDDGAWTTVPLTVNAHESVMALLADPAATPDLFALREQARRWRFYDHLRTDADSPARRPGVATYTPVLSPTGDDLAAALLTIERTGDADALQASVDVAFPGSRLVVTEDDDGVCRVAMTQPGLRRPLSAAELSDGTLTFLLLVAAAHATRPPDLLVLNEPESSLHPSLMPAVGALVASAAERSQVLVVTHAGDLVRALRTADATTIELTKGAGATTVEGAGHARRPGVDVAEALRRFQARGGAPDGGAMAAWSAMSVTRAEYWDGQAAGYDRTTAFLEPRLFAPARRWIAERVVGPHPGGRCRHGREPAVRRRPRHRPDDRRRQPGDAAGRLGASSGRRRAGPRRARPTPPTWTCRTAPSTRWSPPSRCAASPTSSPCCVSWPACCDRVAGCSWRTTSSRRPGSAAGCSGCSTS